MKKTIKNIIKYILRYSIVISYANNDWRYLVHLDNFLSNNGTRVFSAPRSVAGGEDWKKQFKLETRDCDLFIPLISRSSVKKGIVQQEIGIAEGQNKKIYPIVIGTHKFSEKSLGFLHGKQYIRWNDKERDKKILKRLFKGYLERGVTTIIVITVIILIIIFK